MPGPRSWSAGFRRAAPSRCSTIIPIGSARSIGYFGAIETTLEPGPSDATATVKLVDQNQADVGFPSPGVFSLALAQGIPLVSVFHMGGSDVFDFAFRKGEAPPDLKALEGKTVVLGSAGWQSIADPMLKAAGVDISKVKYVDAGWPTWGTALAQGKGDSALTWEGLRAQWKGQGLDFDYILGRNFSKLPANSFVIRKADFEDPAKKEMYGRYFQGWAAGLEFGQLNPRAATQIVMEQFPGLASQMTPAVATESMMQLANVFAGPHGRAQEMGLPPAGKLAAVLRHRPRDRPDHRRLQGRGRGQERPRRCRKQLRCRQGQGRCGGFPAFRRLQGGRRRGDPSRTVVAVRSLSPSVPVGERSERGGVRRRMNYRAIYAYAWDLAETGDGAVDRFRRLGLDTVTIAGSYHAGKFLRPHGQAGKVYFPEDGTVYFRADPRRYGAIKPVVNSMIAERDVLRELTQVEEIAANVWLVLLHNTLLASAHPQATVANAFGDRYIYSLCPSAPEARAYARGLARDVTESYPVSGLSLETPGFLPYAHGFHHEFALDAPNRWLDSLLGLCFCDHCVDGAARERHRRRPSQNPGRRKISAPIWRAMSISRPDMAEAFWLADTRADGDLGAFLDWRSTVVTSLVAEIRAAVRTRGERRGNSFGGAADGRRLV